MAGDPFKPMPEGLPRPLGTLPGGRKAPVPWSQDGSKWGHTDEVRIDLAREFSRCLVCGEPVVEGQVLVVLERLPDGHSGRHHLEDLQPGLDGKPRYVVDQGALHDCCVAITVEHCPAVKRRLARREVDWQLYENETDLPLPPDHWTDGVTTPAPRGAAPTDAAGRDRRTTAIRERFGRPNHTKGEVNPMSPASPRHAGPDDNERHTDAAMQAVAAGTDCEFCTDGIPGLETDIEDLMANLRHLCDRFGLDYGARDAAAYRAYVGDFEDGARVVEREGPPTDPASQLQKVSIVQRQTGDGDGVYVFGESDDDLARRYAERHDGAELRREVVMDRPTAQQLVDDATADEAAES